MRLLAKPALVPKVASTDPLISADAEAEESESVDVMANVEQQAIDALRNDGDIRQKLESTGVPWYRVQQFLIDHLPEHLEDRRQFAFHLVSKAMDAVFGSTPRPWETFKNAESGKTWLRVVK